MHCTCKAHTQEYLQGSHGYLITGDNCYLCQSPGLLKVLNGAFPGEFPPQMMSILPCGFVYITSLQSANKHPLTPHGHVFHASFGDPIRAEAPPLVRPITIACITQLLHSSTRLHIDNIIICILGDVQSNHTSTNQFSMISSKAHLTHHAKPS